MGLMSYQHSVGAPSLIAKFVSGGGAVETHDITRAVDELAVAVTHEKGNHPYGIVIKELGDFSNPAVVWGTYLGARNLVAPTIIKALSAGTRWLEQLKVWTRAAEFSLISTSEDADPKEHLLAFVKDRLSQHKMTDDVYLLLSTSELMATYPSAASSLKNVLLLMHVAGRQRAPYLLHSTPTQELDFRDDADDRDNSDDDDVDAPTLAWRNRFMNDVPTWTAQELPQQTGHSAKNKSALASRWASEGKIFAVKSGGKLRYPQFQFLHGEPRALIAKILRALGPDSSTWDQAFFFAAPNAYLGGDKPMDRLDDKKMEQQLIQLAERHAHPADAF
jgi:hypothetical protein